MINSSEPTHESDQPHDHTNPLSGTAGSTDGDTSDLRGFAGHGSNQHDHADRPESHPIATPTAAGILRDAAEVIEQRAALRDLPNGERSMARAVAAYNALTGSSLTELDGWVFMCALKLSRATAGKPHLDDFTDLAGYAALAGEGVAK